MRLRVRAIPRTTNCSRAARCALVRCTTRGTSNRRSGIHENSSPLTMKINSCAEKIRSTLHCVRTISGQGVSIAKTLAQSIGICPYVDDERARTQTICPHVRFSASRIAADTVAWSSSVNSITNSPKRHPHPRIRHRRQSRRRTLPRIRGRNRRQSSNILRDMALRLDLRRGVCLRGQAEAHWCDVPDTNRRRSPTERIGWEIAGRSQKKHPHAEHRPCVANPRCRR